MSAYMSACAFWIYAHAEWSKFPTPGHDVLFIKNLKKTLGFHILGNFKYFLLYDTFLLNLTVFEIKAFKNNCEFFQKIHS